MNVSILSFFKGCFVAAGLTLAYFLGGWDVFLQILLIVITIDILTGYILSGINHKMSSKVNFSGLLRKVLILMVVGLAVALDTVLGLGEPWIRSAVVIWYICYEGLSILENCEGAGLPLPTWLKDLLQQTQDSKAKGVN